MKALFSGCPARHIEITDELLGEPSPILGIDSGSPTTTGLLLRVRLAFCLGFDRPPMRASDWGMPGRPRALWHRCRPQVPRTCMPSYFDAINFEELNTTGDVQWDGHRYRIIPLRWAGSGRTMEPIDYGGALRRSWRLLVGLAILGAVIAAFIPVGHAKRVKSALPYQATAIVGTAPNGNGSPLNGGVSASQLMFFASKTDTQQGVADAAGLTIPDYELSAYMSA